MHGRGCAVVLCIVLSVVLGAILGTVLGQEAVGVELSRRHGRAKQRRGAEPDIADAGEFQRAFVGAVTRIDLLELCRGVVRPHLCADPPGRGLDLSFLRGRTGERDVAVKMRRVPVKGQDPIEIGGHWLFARIDGQMHAGTVAVAGLSGRDAKRIAGAVQGEAAVAAHRACQRPHVAGKGDVVQLQCLAAGGIVQRNAPGEVQAVDRQRAEIELPVHCRQIDLALPVEAEVERQPADGELVGAPLAAHQIAQAELDIELVGAKSAEIVGAADRHRSQAQRRRRQEPRIQGAIDPHRRTDNPRCLGLELRPELVPVDKIGPDQRGNQRNDECNRQSEQRRLHGVSS